MAAAIFVRIVLVWALAQAGQLVSGPRPLEGTYWKAIELEGKAMPSSDSIREVYLLLKEQGRIYGSDGCNRVAGTYQADDTSVRFSEMAVTRMACTDEAHIDVAFRDVLKSARRLVVAGEHLELFDSGNRRVAVFLAASSYRPDPDKR
jgi:heat shock protein HslJ